MRSSPKPSTGQGERDATQSVADGIELAPVALELLALRVDDRRRRVRHEAIVREHRLGALDLLAQARTLGLHVAVRLHALRLEDRVEDATLVVALEQRHDTRAPEHL